MTKFTPLKLRRLPDWQGRLTTFITESQQEGAKCDWEFMNCGSWAALCVEEITGVDLYEPFRAFDISTPEGAYKALKRLGFDTMEDYVATRLIEKPVILANRGDLVCAPADQVSELTAQELGAFPNAMCIADPPFLWGLGLQGVGRVPLLSASRCFKVG